MAGMGILGYAARGYGYVDLQGPAGADFINIP
jgi:hypothetical protein